ncbi:hypothetical protein NKH49_30145 [Mesorhizobium sp. M1088]|uniref:hypothetical protein n=1 Tax=Mesorhizobium sp. M1088 TaxID=2957056 RepID=UPI00333C8480
MTKSEVCACKEGAPRPANDVAIQAGEGMGNDVALGPRQSSARPFPLGPRPETDGENLNPEEIDELVQAVAQQTAFGLGLLKAFDDDTAPVPRHCVRVADDQEKRFFGGAIITPFGPLDVAGLL